MSRAQRGIKFMSAWCRMAQILKHEKKGPDFPYDSIPPASTSLMGVWLNGCKEEHGLWNTIESLANFKYPTLSSSPFGQGFRNGRYEDSPIVPMATSRQNEGTKLPPAVADVILNIKWTKGKKFQPEEADVFYDSSLCRYLYLFPGTYSDSNDEALIFGRPAPNLPYLERNRRARMWGEPTTFLPKKVAPAPEESDEEDVREKLLPRELFPCSPSPKCNRYHSPSPERTPLKLRVQRKTRPRPIEESSAVKEVPNPVLPMTLHGRVENKPAPILTAKPLILRLRAQESDS
ncbi:hypothetical protein CVT26_004352 [Gymnopilus dilepis]|uniref:Uncharacterized protein n=1 Tax=Gymnopilus dilepis TaxID=231916 RepID=A0A409WU58_9AGAR|nr:hypothetical protein CVT26_004352 [Gymnopilus dilepis]